MARKYGLSTERVRQIALQAGLRAEDWRKVARDGRRAAAETTRPDGPLGLVWDEVLAHGLSVKRDLTIIGGGTFKPTKHYLLIQGHHCMVSIAYRPWGHARGLQTPYGYHHFGQRERDFYILVNQVPGYKRRIFVIPWTAVDVTVKERNFYVPLEKRPIHNNLYSRLDWWDYENAWHLLKNSPPRRRNRR
jgi:hypothetical protein